MPALSNRVVSIYNRKTSVRFAPAEWEAIEHICHQENIPRKILFELIDLNHDEKMSFASAIRLFLVIYYKNAVSNINTPQKHNKDEFFSPIFEAIKGII